MAYTQSKPRRPKNAAGTGKVATAAAAVKFQQLVTRPHLRQAEIDAQPTLVSMPWDGKGVFWRQGSAGYVGKEG